MSMWRYVQNGQPSLPVETGALQALLAGGGLSPDTLVWKEGMTNWVAAKSVPEFAGARPASPPAPPPPAVPATPQLPPIPAPSAATGSAAEDIEKNRAFAIIASGGCLIIGFIPFVNLILMLAVPLLWLAGVVLMILGIVNAAGGQFKPLPLIGHFELIK